MAREEKKRVELREVDDEVAPVVEVVRLENRETVSQPKDETPVRLGPQASDREPSRLELPSHDEVELRTHQPGIEALIAAENTNADLQEEGWGESTARRHPIPWGWFALIGLAIAGAVLWSLVHLRDSDETAGQIREETESVLAKEEREEREARELINRIEDSLRHFFNATTVDALAASVRHPERVIPLMREHHENQPVFQSPVRTIRGMQPLTLDSRANFWVASVALANGSLHNLIIEIDEAGNSLIDWETLVCYQPMPWDEFALERPVGRPLDFRVYAERDMFFSHEFADSKRWLCFRLTALDSEETLFGYISVDNDDVQKLLNLVEANAGGRTSLILRLGIPGGLQSRRGVVIEKVISPRWIHLDPPDSMP